MTFSAMQRVLVCSFVLALLVVLSADVAGASILTVNCQQPGDLQAAIDGLNRTDRHWIYLTGTCTENLFIYELDGLTIEAPAGQTATIQASDPEDYLVNVVRSQRIRFRRLIFSGGYGIRMRDQTQALMELVTVENSAGDGIVITANSTLRVSNSIIRNNATSGLTVGVNSDAAATDTAFDNNTVYGMVVVRGFLRVSGTPGQTVVQGSQVGMYVQSSAYAFAAGDVVIQNNYVAGVQATWGSHVELFGTWSEGGLLAPRVHNNGTATDPQSAGVTVDTNSSLVLLAGVEVTQNVGPGVRMDQTTSIDVDGSTISNNSGDGIVLLHHSVAEFANDYAPSAMLGNGGAAVSCDTSSQLFGDLTGVSPIQCANTQRRAQGRGPSAAAARNRMVRGLVGKPEPRQ